MSSSLLLALLFCGTCVGCSGLNLVYRMDQWIYVVERAWVCQLDDLECCLGSTLEVAGWGGIYSHQPKSSCWWSVLAKGAPDSTGQCPVCRHVILPLGLEAGRPLEALSSCGTGQSGVAPDSPVPLWPLLWLLPRYCSLCRVDRCAQIAVAPLVHRTVRWHTGQSGEL
jgi:hypothetical protein